MHDTLKILGIVYISYNFVSLKLIHSCLCEIIILNSYDYTFNPHDLTIYRKMFKFMASCIMLCPFIISTQVVKFCSL